MMKICIIFFSLLLNACAKDNKDLLRYIKEIKARPTKAMQIVPPSHSLASFKFPKHDKRRNPFVLSKAEDKAVLYKKIKEPLESLKLVGTLKQGSRAWAYIRQVDQIIRVKAGDYIGQNDARIIAIKKDAIQLQEMKQTSEGWKKNRITMYLDADRQMTSNARITSSSE